MPLDRLVRTLSSRASLDDGDRSAILALPHTLQSYHPATYIIREGQPPRVTCAIINSGSAYSQKLTFSGTRQIVSLHLPGNFIDLQSLFLNVADHNVQALTEVELIEIDRRALRRLSLERPAVAEAFWVDGLIDSSFYREWVVNVGRRDARTRIAHLFCEL